MISFDGIMNVVLGLMIVAVICYQASTIPYHISFLRESRQFKEQFMHDFNQDHMNEYGFPVYYKVSELNYDMVKGLIGRIGFIVFGLWYCYKFVL